MAFRRGSGDGEVAPYVAPDMGAPEALTAFIDQGSEFEGKLSFKNTVRIDGSFKGEISSENTLIVGEPGTVVASIRSCNVIVSGEVSGDIVATERIVLHKTARVDGNITAPRLVVEEGAVIEGCVEMGAAAGASKAKANGNGKTVDVEPVSAEAVN